MTVISRNKREYCWMRDRYRCYYCGTQLGLDEATMDHRIPRQHGGSNREDNLVTCCGVCNRAKNNRSEQEWNATPRAERERLRRIQITGARS